jgi:hypothetical protein
MHSSRPATARLGGVANAKESAFEAAAKMGHLSYPAAARMICFRLVGLAALIGLTIVASMPWTLLLIALDVLWGAFSLGMCAMVIVALIGQRRTAG